MHHPATKEALEDDYFSEHVLTPGGRRIQRKGEPPAEVRTYEAVNRRVALGDVFKSFDVTRTLASQAFKVRYKQSALGPIWLVAQPAVLLGVLTLIFSGVVAIKIPNHISYATFALVGLTVWGFFQVTLMTGGQAFVSNAALVRYFPTPRITFVLALLAVALLPLTLMLPATLIAAGLGPGFGLRTLVTPLLLAWIILFTGTVTLMLATITVRFRDLLSLVPFVLQVGLFVTPIAYPFSLAGHKIQVLLALNPLSGIIEAWRWAVLGLSPNVLALAVSGAATLLVAVAAWRIFVREEPLFADRI